MEPKYGLYDDSADLEPAASTKYRQVIGSLQYLTTTRPDIAYMVKEVDQFMSNSKKVHWTSIQRILRYLSGTPFASITIMKLSTLELRAFADTYSTGDVPDRRSCGGHFVKDEGTGNNGQVRSRTHQIRRTTGGYSH